MGPCLRVTDVAHPGLPMLVLYLLSSAHRSVPPLRCPIVTAGGGGWIIQMLSQKARWSSGVGPLGIKPGLWSNLGSKWRPLGINPGLWSH